MSDNPSYWIDELVLEVLEHLRLNFFSQSGRTFLPKLISIRVPCIVGHSKVWQKSANLAEFHYQFSTVFLVCRQLARFSFVLNCWQKMTHLINFFHKGGSNVEDSTKSPGLDCKTSLRTIISNTTEVLYCTKIHDTKG